MTNLNKTFQKLIILFHGAKRLLTLLSNLLQVFQARRVLNIYPSKIQDSITRTSLRTNITLSDLNIRLEYAKLLRKILLIDEHFSLKRIGGDGDGGYVLHDLDYRRVLSIGVGKEYSFELDSYFKRSKIYMFDHTIPKLNNLPENITFYRKGLARNHSKQLLTFDEIQILAGISTLDCQLLKIDIEGNEYDSLQNSNFYDYSTIVIELHWLEKMFYSDEYPKLIKLMDRLTSSHRIVNVHANNWTHLFNIGNIVLPDVVELSLVREDLLVQLNMGTKDNLNLPCRRNYPEIWPVIS